ncbi:hypothetical protein A9Z42_0038760 [Trichoderma parareesei]|uniref:Protein SQS1 n=1 Tax=Trichoderma parareesei TaxID=858221 RepID=A0A2H2ZVW1_TRIPA|nr:hypothetical protein A9Z42_0038760 [Trichoderma parareesei]
MGGRNRASQKQRNGWNQSPRRGQNFGSPSPRNDVTFRGFTLEEEARQTSSHHDWSSTVQLRKRPVVFVSSGSHDPLQSLTPQDDKAKDASITVGIAEEAAPRGETPREAAPREAAPEEAALVGAASQGATEGTRPIDVASIGTQPVGPASEDGKHVELTSEQPDLAESTSEEPKPVDPTSEEANPMDPTAERASSVEAKNGEDADEEATLEQITVRGTAQEKDGPKGVAPGRTGFEEPVPTEATPEESIEGHPETDNTGSSDEVIVFKGRNAMKAKTQGPNITLTTIETEIRAVEKQISAASEESPRRLPIRPAKGDDDDSDHLLWPTRKRGKARGRRNRGKGSEEDAMLADYIANMRENGEMFEGLGDDDEEEESSEDGEGLPSATAGPKAVDDDDEDDDDTDDDDAIHPDVYDGLLDASPSELEDDDILEEHNEFDVMDWERPSVRRRKGKGGRLPFSTEGLDSDTEEALRTAYNNDRHKKAERKKEREELRAMGLLGKRGQVDLRAKYSTGITMSQVVEEVKAFLAGSQETYVYPTPIKMTTLVHPNSPFPSLSLPPMDPHTRKGVHELSHKLGIKSKSIGGGDQRRPVLYRTKKTSYNEREFEQVIVMIKRRFGRQPSFKADSRKNRQGQKGPKGPKGSKPLGRSGGGAFSYHEGEVIGASAPELGTENRGRAMMEKMGWSTGTPLGASDNQGILHPVSQTMKKSRAGLGQE